MRKKTKKTLSAEQRAAGERAFEHAKEHSTRGGPRGAYAGEYLGSPVIMMNDPDLGYIPDNTQIVPLGFLLLCEAGFSGSEVLEFLRQNLVGQKRGV